MEKTVENLLNAPYPFEHEHHKTIYERCGQLFLTKINLYQCNFCKIKVLGEERLLEHNRSFSHQNEMGKQIHEVLKKSAPLNKVSTIKLSEAAKEKLGKAAIQAAKMKLDEAMAELKNEYENYRHNPCMHPMYTKEWQVFYLRRLSEILAKNIDPTSHNFAKDWTTYWVKRIQVYYNKALQKIIFTIGANYKLTLDETDVTKALQENNAQHSDIIHANADHDKKNLASGIENCGHAKDDVASGGGGNDDANGDSVNEPRENGVDVDHISSNNSDDNANGEFFLIANRESVPNEHTDIVIDLDSDATTEDETSACEPESGPKEQLKLDESESDDDALTSRIRLPLPQHLIDEALKLSKDDSPAVTSSQEPLNVINQSNNTVDSDAVADSVLSFFEKCGLNPANLSDDQVQQYIEYIVKSRMEAANDNRAGSVETLDSSDSSQSWRFT